MKKLIIITAIFLGYFLTTAEASSKYRHYNRYNNNIDVDFFFDALEPYGEWIEIGYDEYVWRPDFVGYNWKPYSEGRWEWTRNGWHWVSYEAFGWATYHYGRWFYDDFYGWVWMPDNVWAPAWVEWRNNNNYIGWAPLPPYASFNRNRGIYFSVRWNSGYNHWNFVTYNHFGSIHVNNYYVNHSKSRHIFKSTKHRTNYYDRNNRIVNGGIDRRYVERKSGRKISTRDIITTKSNRNLVKRNSTNTRREVVSYRPNKTELSKVRKIDRTKITKGRKLKSLKTDKVSIRKSREINKNNRKDITKRKSELRKTESKNKTYKPIVKRSKNVEKKSYDKMKSTNGNNNSVKRKSTEKKENTRVNKRVEKKSSNNSTKVKTERKVVKRNNNSSTSRVSKSKSENTRAKKKVVNKTVRTKSRRIKS
ncbi:MAG: hypothetical protein GY936_01910 [Ignavibacteriae bacterium]|nr:hypothetical protein [Ignavibacteriota bacterium]